MSADNYVKYISEQVRKEKVRGFTDVTISEAAGSNSSQSKAIAHDIAKSHPSGKLDVVSNGSRHFVYHKQDKEDEGESGAVEVRHREGKFHVIHHSGLERGYGTPVESRKSFSTAAEAVKHGSEVAKKHDDWK